MINMTEAERAEFQRRIREEADRRRAEMVQKSLQAESTDPNPSSQPVPDMSEMRDALMSAFNIDPSVLNQQEDKPIAVSDDGFEFEGFTPRQNWGTQSECSSEESPVNSSTYDDFDDGEDDIFTDNVDDFDYASGEDFENTQTPMGTSPSQVEESTNDIAAELERVRKQNAELMKLILQQQQQLHTTQQFMQQASQQNTQVRNEVFNNKQGFEDLTFEACTSEFCGQPFRYERYEQPVQFSRRFERGLTDEDTTRNYFALCNEVCADIEQKFGGWDRITDLAVVSNLLIINSVSYEPVLPSDYANSLPYDLRNNVRDGQFAWLFDYGLLKRMKNLVNLKFDSEDFVYCKVRKDLHITYNFSCKSLFKVCKRLRHLQIGIFHITEEDPSDHSELFHRASRAEEIRLKLSDGSWEFTKNRWSSIKTVYQDADRSGLGKVVGITWHGVGLLGAGATTLGARGVGLISKIGKGLGNIASAVKDNLN